MNEIFLGQAEWRKKKALEYPNDTRNQDAVRILEKIAANAEVPALLMARVECLLYDGQVEVLNRYIQEIGFHRQYDSAEELYRDFFESENRNSQLYQAIEPWLTASERIGQGIRIADLNLTIPDAKGMQDVGSDLLHAELGDRSAKQLIRFFRLIRLSPKFDEKKPLNEMFTESELRRMWADMSDLPLVDPVVRRRFQAGLFLRRMDMKLERTPSHHWSRKHYEAGYQIVNDRNLVVAGAHGREYELTLDEVEAFIESECERRH